MTDNIESYDEEPERRDDPYAVVERLRQLTAPRPEDIRARGLFDRLLRRGPDGAVLPEPALVGINREARGLVVTGATGAGKSTLVKKLLRAHPAFPGFGVPGAGCKILTVTAQSPANLKSLGHDILDHLGWQAPSRGTEKEIWRIVNVRLRELDYRVLHLDEAQRVAQNRSPDEIKNICDTWISLLQPPNPVVVILSGVETLLDVVNGHRQCFRRFSKLALPPIGVGDLDAIMEALDAYCRTAGIEFDDEPHLILRLIHASANTYGIAIEYAVDAIAEALDAGDDTLRRGHFAAAYAAATGCLPTLNPFLVDEWSSVPVTKPEPDDEQDAPARKKKRSRK